MNLKTITSHALNGKGCSFAEAEWLVTTVSEDDLFKSANAIREHFFGNRIQLCMIINAKCGECSMDCSFCSQSVHNSTEIETFPLLSDDELQKSIQNIADSSAKHCGIVTSGGRLSKNDVERICDIAKKQENMSHLNLCGSLGRLSYDDFLKLKQSGLKRYHHNLETSEYYYSFVCSTQKWEQRYDTVKKAIDSGLEVCSGGLFGLGESWKDRIELAFSLKSLNVGSIPINYLYPHKGTPLEKKEILSPEEALKIVAIYRHVLPDATLRICGGRTVILKDRKYDMFRAGANAIMTGNYLTTSGQIPDEDLKLINELGLEVDQH